MHWYLKVLMNYAGYDGRAHRKEYWMFVLFNFIFSLGISFAEELVGGLWIIAAFYHLAILIPSIAVTIRRLHDTNRSGWWLLISFIPIVGAIALLVFLTTVSHEGSNRFGPDPREATV